MRIFPFSVYDYMFEVRVRTDLSGWNNLHPGRAKFGEKSGNLVETRSVLATVREEEGE